MTVLRLGDTACRVLAAVLTLHARNGVVGILDVAEVVGRRKSATWRALGQLKAAGLIDWEPHKKATLRPTCTVISQDERACEHSATLGPELSGQGAVGAAPGRGRHLQGGADMAGPYSRTPSLARGQA